MSEETGLLIPLELYEESGVNIGTKQKSADMLRFIDTVNSDGLYPVSYTHLRGPRD